MNTVINTNNRQVSKCGIGCCVVDMWPGWRSCNCQLLSACDSQSQLDWQFSFSRLLHPSSLHPTSFTSRDHTHRQSLVELIAGLRCQSAADVARRSLEGDTDQISSLAGALDRLTSLVDQLHADLTRAARACSSYVDALHRRLVYHVEVALRAGVKRVFRELFVAEFDRVRRRSVTPLLEGSQGTVADVDRTIKQLRFTATSENVARKVQYVHNALTM